MAGRSVPTPRVASSNLLCGARTFWHQVITKYGVERSALDRMLEHVLRFRLARPTINSGLQTGIPICHNRAFGELAGTCAVTAFENIAGMQRFKISISPAVPTVAN